MKKLNLLSLSWLSALFLLPLCASVHAENTFGPRTALSSDRAATGSVYKWAFSYPTPDSYYLILYNVPVNAPAAGGMYFIPVQSNTTWSVSGILPAWLSISGDSGSGNGTITVTVAANSTGANRWATLMISGDGVAPYPFDINQSK